MPQPCQLPVLPCSGRFPHISFGTKEPLCAQQQRGHSQRRFVPTCLPITPTHRGQRAWLGNGEGFFQVSGSSQESGKTPPPKKSRQKIHYPPAWGCVSGRPRAGTGTGFEQVLHCGVPWGVWGALMGWEQVGSILPKLEPRSSSHCVPANCTFILFTYFRPSPRST